MSSRIEKLEREIETLRKINRVLMERVERSVDSSGGDFALFEYTIILQKHVDERTAELEKANSRLAELLEEQHRVATKLVESEERYRLIFDQSRDAMMTLAPPTWKFTSGNPAICEMFGISDVAQFAGMEPWIVSPERQPDGRLSESKALDMIGLAMRNGSHFFEWMHRRLGGEVFPATVLLARIEIAGEVFLHATVRDISDQKRAEMDMRQSEERARRQRAAIERLVLDDSLIGGDMSEAINRITEVLSSTMEVERASVWTLSEDGFELRCISLYESENNRHTHGQVLKTINIPRYFAAILSESRICAENAQTDPRTSELTEGYLASLGITSMLDAVISMEGKPTGIVCLEHIGPVRKWHVDEENFVSTMASLVAQVFNGAGRKKAEQDLIIFKESLNNSFDAIGISTPQGIHYYQNRAFGELFGEVGEDPTRVYVEKRVATQMFKTIMSGGLWSGEVRMYNREGQIRDIFLRAYANRDERGIISALVGVHTDITEHKRAEMALKVSEQRYRNLYENLRDGSFAVDLSEKIVECNRQFLNMLGNYSFEEISRLTYGDITPVQWHAMEIDILKNQVDKRGYSDIYEKEYIRKDGSVIPVEIQTYLVLDSDGNASGYWAFVRDIAERKRAEEEREKMHAQLIQARKMESVGRLAGGVAHDFNNMLGVILGYSELVLQQMEDSDPNYSGLQEIRKAAKRSADLTSQLLAFARKQTVAPRVLDLNETVEGMLKMLRRLIGEDIELLWLPEGDSKPIKLDPSQIDQILANLCVNARDAINGIGRVSIETGSTVLDRDNCAGQPGCVPGEYVMLAVSDNGRGMDAYTLENLFEPFFTTKNVGEGTGLGLATVYGIVKQNNGYINVDSEPGSGTTFRIYFPVYCIGGEKTVKNIPGKIELNGRETVLLVEDEPAILNITRNMLERLGYVVLAAGLPGEAIQIAREHSGEIHLLMTDVVMPEMNGRDLAKNLLALYPDLKRLFMSGYTADVIAHHGVLDEGVHFIQKPFTMQDLAAVVRKAIDN